MSQRLAPGKARVQYLACRDEIEKLLEAGETLAGAHQILLERGVLNIPYKSLHALHSGKIRLRAVFKRSGMKNKKQETENTNDTESSVEKNKEESPKTIQRESKQFLKPSEQQGI